MAGLIPPSAVTVLEPTPGEGNLVRAIIEVIRGRTYLVTPKDFFKITPGRRFDCIVMNPPFSMASCFGAPAEFKGMRIGYEILRQCMEMSDNIIALMPWFTLIDSDVRMRTLKAWGMKSITSLPRKTFEYARIQTVVIELQKGYQGDTIFKTFEY